MALKTLAVLAATKAEPREKKYKLAAGGGALMSRAATCMSAGQPIPFRANQFGKTTDSATSAVEMQRALWPQNGTTTAF